MLVFYCTNTPTYIFRYSTLSVLFTVTGWLISARQWKLRCRLLGVQRTNLSLPLFFGYFKNTPTVVFYRFLPPFLRIFHRYFLLPASTLMHASILHSFNKISPLYSRDLSLFCSIFQVRLLGPLHCSTCELECVTVGTNNRRLDIYYLVSFI